MLSCREVGDISSDYLEGNLSWWKRAELRLHIAMCRHCQRYFVQMSFMIRALRLLGARDAASERSREDILRMLRERRQT